MPVDFFRAPIPRAPSSGALQNPELAIGDAEEGLVVLYDPGQRVGAIFWRELGMWSVLTPIELGAFIQWLQTNRIRLPEGEDLARWFDAIERARQLAAVAN